jgi:hypothetical protein
VLNLSGFTIERHSIIETENEPVLVVLAVKTDASRRTMESIYCSQEALHNSVAEELQNSRRYFGGLEAKKNIFLIGANHKSINLIDIACIDTPNLTLLDGNPSKVGKYTTKFNMEILPLGEMNSVRHSLLLTTISPRKIHRILQMENLIISGIAPIRNVYCEIRRLGISNKH